MKNKKGAELIKFIFDHQKGMITPLILIMAAIFMIFAVSLLNWAITSNKDTVRKVRKVQSFQVAEAGVNYYKWLLAHNDSDYQDGNNWCCETDPAKTASYCLAAYGACGPYIHDYKDYNEAVVGQFSLMITPPEIGSTIATIRSTGHAYGTDSITKTIISRVGKRSLAEYSFLTNSPIWIGEDESIVGPLHSNSGVKFDGTGNAEITSSVETYNCYAEHHGCTAGDPIRDGIWREIGGTSPYWRFPVPVIDFDLFSVDLANIKALAAEEDGDCNGRTEDRGICFGNSTKSGYLVRFQSSPAKVRIYKVNTLENKVWYYNYEKESWQREAEQIKNTTEVSGSPFDMPDNGLIFIEDDVWVEGTIEGRATVVAARFPENPNKYAKIRINNNVRYLARDGSYNLGLMAQGDILVPRYAPTNLTIDAVLLSQKGHVYYRYYWPNSIKNNIEVYGGIITNLFWTWTWVDWNGSSWVTVDGYNTTNTIYNNYLTYIAPPSFLTSENFEVLSWEEE